MARWQSGYAAACKAVYLGSTPGLASICTCVLITAIGHSGAEYGYTLTD
jgi:hypothetical protein